MRKTFAVTVVSDGFTTTIVASGVERIGGTMVDSFPQKEVSLVLPADGEPKQILKEALIHLVEHL